MNRILLHLPDRAARLKQRLEVIRDEANLIAGDDVRFYVCSDVANLACGVERFVDVDDPTEAAPWLRDLAASLVAAAARLEGGAA